MLLLDTPEWLRRAVWAVVAGVGLLAVLAIVQQVTKTYGSTYGGFASVLPDGDALRSAGPLNPNPFGQVLATSAVLAFYLARTQRAPARARLRGRARRRLRRGAGLHPVARGAARAGRSRPS